MCLEAMRLAPREHAVDVLQARANVDIVRPRAWGSPRIRLEGTV